MRNKLGSKALSVVMSVVLAMGLCPGLAIADNVSNSKALSPSTAIPLQSAGVSIQAAVSYRVPVDQNGKLCVTGWYGELYNGVKHNGMDIAPFNAYKFQSFNVYASAAGQVVASTYHYSWGNYVKIKHADGCYTLYAHLSSRSVSYGAKVSQGQVVGVMGQTGEAYGKHVHFEYYRGGEASKYRTDPRNVVKFPNKYVGITSSNSSGGTPTKQTVATPVVAKAADIIGGQSIKVTSSTGGASLYYTLNGSNPNTSSNKYSSPFNNTWNSMTVKALGTKSGWNNSAVSKAYTFTTKQAKTPVITVNNTATGAVVHMASDSGATIVYTTDRSNPSVKVGGTSPSITNGKKFSSDIKVTRNTTFKAIAVKPGLRNSAVSAEVEAVCAAPSTPKPSVKSEKIAVKDAAQISWKADSAASEYAVTLYKNGKSVGNLTTSGAVATFNLPEVGKYEIGVVAKNYFGSSVESERVRVEAMPDCRVRFVDEHEEDASLEIEVVNEQVVRYGYSASKPASPSKRGYSFAGWDGSLTSITADTDIKSTWDIKKYVVQFYASDGTTRLSRQIVEFNSSASAPEPPAPATGYVFSGWQVVDADDDSTRDCAKVDSNMKLRAVYSWADKELPNVVSVTDATRTAEGIYTVKVKLTNYPYDTTTALLRVALKTKSGKLVQTARETVSISKNSTVERTVTLKYTGDYIATVAEAEVVGFDGNYRTGGACSKAATATIKTGDGFSYSAWSGWSTTEPAPSDTVQVEKATQYRYRDKKTTTSTATSLAGWTRDGKSTTTYGAWSGEKSTTSKPATSDTLTISGQSTKYNYYHWHSKYDNCMNQDSCWVNSTSVKHTVSTASPLSGPKYVFADKGGKASKEYGPYGTCSWKPSKAYWWLESTVTTYKYKTRTKTVNYGYYKWDDSSWSGWSNDRATASDSRQVETRTVWRYRTKQNTTGTEDSTGTKYDITGTLSVDADLAGKEATIMVYNATNTDPNEDQMQYIGQTTIGTGNSYSFSFIPRLDPTPDTGDFVVALGVKGATGLVNVSTIKAPRAQYKVTFQYTGVDGNVVTVSEQDVNEGDNAEVPDAPTLTGNRFIGWSDSAQRVYSDLTVTALFAPETYTVAWVNWATEDVYLQNCSYGDVLEAPSEASEVEGMTFKGWDAIEEGIETVTESMTVNALYAPVVYKVSFTDGAGNVISEQLVAYGDSAELPEINPAMAGKVFMGWDTSTDAPWWNVKGDMEVAPLFAYEESANSPVIDVPETEKYVGPAGEKVYLSTSTDDAKIYYTTDGSEPSEPVESSKDWETGNTSILYDPSEGITVTKPVTLRAVAVRDGMNDSCESSADIDITATNDIEYAQCVVGDAYYTGEPVEPGVGVWFGDTVLEPDVDYTVSYVGNEDIGTATARVEGIGNYTGSQVVSFEITKFDESMYSDYVLDIAHVSVPSIAVQVYTGKAITPSPIVKYEGETLTKNADYTLSYKNNTNVGTATVTVKGINGYSGSVSVTFKINPKGTSVSKLTAQSKGFTATWKKQATQATGYQLQYCTASNFKSGVKTVTVAKAGTVSKKVTKLAAKKKYYVRVRTYKAVGKVNYYSAWSATKTVTTKK